MGDRPGGAPDEANKATAERRIAATEELRDRHDRLTGATAALIVAIREAGEGPWVAGSGPTEEALPRWLEEQGNRMEALKEILDQKQRELGTRNLGSRGQVGVLRQDSNQPGELPHWEVEDLVLKKGFTVKEPEGGGTKGTIAQTIPR